MITTFPLINLACWFKAHFKQGVWETPWLKAQRDHICIKAHNFLNQPQLPHTSLKILYAASHCSEDLCYISSVLSQLWFIYRAGVNGTIEVVPPQNSPNADAIITGLPTGFQFIPVSADNPEVWECHLIKANISLATVKIKVIFILIYSPPDQLVLLPQWVSYRFA